MALAQHTPDLQQADPWCQIMREDFCHHHRFTGVHCYSARIARSIGMGAISVWCPGPGQQHPGAQFGQAASPHALGDKSALVFGHCAANLQQQLVVRIPVHRSVKEFNLTAMLFEFFEQHHLMDIIACQTIGCDQYQSVNAALPHGISQAVQSRTIQACAAVAVVTENQLLAERHALFLDVGAQTSQLFVNGLLLNLICGRHPHIEGNSHHASPFPMVAEVSPDNGSIPAAIDRLDPSAAGRPATGPSADERAIDVSWRSPQKSISAEGHADADAVRCCHTA